MKVIYVMLENERVHSGVAGGGSGFVLFERVPGATFQFVEHRTRRPEDRYYSRLNHDMKLDDVQKYLSIYEQAVCMYSANGPLQRIAVWALGERYAAR